MTDYLYTPLELALIIRYHKMTVQDYAEMLHNIFRYDNVFLLKKYRHDEKKLMLDVMDKLNYLNDRRQYDNELVYIEKDKESFGLPNNSNGNMSTDVYSHLLFKELRIRILYINKRNYAKMKLRTLLSEVGYKRRSVYAIDYISKCFWFYHLSVSLKENTPCDITKIKFSDTIVFKVV